MAEELQKLYFRTRDNGAAVFRIDVENRQRRLDLQQIAVINIRNGEFKAHGEAILSAFEQSEISNWIATRRETLKARDLDNIQRAVDQLNQTAQWAQSKASDAELEVVTDDLLMAMHDLRAVLVRKKSDRIPQA